MVPIEDHKGVVWIGGNRGVVRWSHGAQMLYQTEALKTNSADGVAGLAAGSDGSIWVGISARGRGLGLQQLIQDRWQPVKNRELDGEAL